jgi:hypothetical protein
MAYGYSVKQKCVYCSTLFKTSSPNCCNQFRKFQNEKIQASRQFTDTRVSHYLVFPNKSHVQFSLRSNSRNYRLLLNRKINYRLQNSLPMVTIPSQVTPIAPTIISSTHLSIWISSLCTVLLHSGSVPNCTAGFSKIRCDTIQVSPDLSNCNCYLWRFVTDETHADPETPKNYSGGGH